MPGKNARRQLDLVSNKTHLEEAQRGRGEKREGWSSERGSVDVERVRDGSGKRWEDTYIKKLTEYELCQPQKCNKLSESYTVAGLY